MTELAKKENNELVDVSMFKGAPSGFEGVDASTFKTPFVKILQSLSPELKKSDPNHIPEAEAGLFCNTATQELYNEINVIIIRVDHSLVVWRPERGGFVGHFPKSQEADLVVRKEGPKKWDAEGNDVNDTVEFFCVNADNPSDVFIMPMSTTAFKYARSFATRLRMLKSGGKAVNVSWAGVWNIKTSEDSNDKGSWYTIGNTPEFVRFITKEEKEGVVIPASEIFTKAETDYSTLDTKAAASGPVNFDDTVPF